MSITQSTKSCAALGSNQPALPSLLINVNSGKINQLLLEYTYSKEVLSANIKLNIFPLRIQTVLSYWPYKNNYCDMMMGRRARKASVYCCMCDPVMGSEIRVMLVSGVLEQDGINLDFKK